MKNRIKEVRAEKKITQQQLADKLFISRQAVSKLENSDSVTTSTLEKIAAALNCSIVDLIDKSDYETASQEEKRQVLDSVFEAGRTKVNRAVDIVSAAGYTWVLSDKEDGLIHLVDKKTDIEYTVEDEAFTAAVDGSAEFIEFNFTKLMKTAKVVK